jgi:hypothetical protein
MSRVKPVRDLKAAVLPAPNVSKRIELNKDNAPLFAAKFLEEIRDEFKKLNENLQDIIANQRDV